MPSIPSEYFDQRSLAELEFSSAFFRAWELSAIVAADPLFKLVRPFRGWVHGFIEPQFRAWLQDPNLGPQAGPRLRPFFHLDLAEPRRTHLHETEPGLQTEGTPSDAA